MTDVPDKSGGGDPYEQRYMAGEGEILLRDKMRVPWFFHLLFVMPLLIALGMPFIDPAAGFGAWLALPIMAVAWAIFSTLRVVVSEEQVHIQYGLFGPKIPVKDIVLAEAESYNWMKYGGYGIRKGMDGTTAYNLIGDKGRGVRIHWRDAKGKVKKVLISSPHPERVAAAIQQARAKSQTGADLSETRAALGVLDAPDADSAATLREDGGADQAVPTAAVSVSADNERD